MRFNSKLDRLTDKTKDRFRQLSPEERFRQFVGAGPDKQKALVETIPDAEYRMPDADHADRIEGFHRAVEAWLFLWKSASVDYAWAFAGATVTRMQYNAALDEGDFDRAEELLDEGRDAAGRDPKELADARAEKLAGIHAALLDWLADIDVDEEDFWLYLDEMADTIRTRIDLLPEDTEPDPETREMTLEVLTERGRTDEH